MGEYISVLISALISIVGFVITYNMMKKEFRNSINISLHDERKKLYVVAYGILEKARLEKEIVCEDSYINELTDVWIKLSIIANPKVFVEFDKVYNKLKEKHNNYKEFYDSHSLHIDECGNLRTVAEFSDKELRDFNNLISSYKYNNILKYYYFTTSRVLKEMKADLGTDI